MFHAFLHLHLDLAFVAPDVERHLSERAGDELPENQHQRREDQQRPGERAVHRMHQQKGADQLDERDHGAGQQRRGSFRYHVDIFGKPGRDVSGMEFLPGIELLVEQAAESFDPDQVGLSGLRHGRHIVVQLAERHAAQHHDGQQGHHEPDFPVSTSTDGLVDEAAAERDHPQAERNLCDTHEDPHQGIPADTLHLAPYPADVSHATMPSSSHWASRDFTSASAVSDDTS